MTGTPLDKSLLLDFYGELLTEKQRRACELHWNEDLSLGEIAQQEGLSRQGVWDTLRRAEAALEEYEAKTGLVGRFLERRETIAAIRAELAALLPEDDGRSRDILARLEELI